MAPPEIIFLVFSFIWGAIWGSFCNVLIHRLPRDESILSPPSHCPSCGKTIRWYQNVPIFSYVFLRGKCASCGVGISTRYPLVELVCATLSVAIWQSVAYDPHIPSVGIALACFIFRFYFILSLVAITFIDLEYMVIPDVISLPAIGVGIAYNAVMSDYSLVPVLDAVIGAAAGGGVIALIIVVYHAITKREGMGWGDSKLLAMLGAFLGYKSLVFVLLAGSLQGLAYVGLLLMSGQKMEDGVRRTAIPFGPFLALGGLEWLLFSDQVQDWFQALFGI